MGLLGNGFDDPQSSAIMALAGGLLQGNFGGGLLAANQAVTDSRKQAMQNKLLEAQLKNFDSEIEARKLAGIKDARQQKLMESMFPGMNGGGAPAGPSMSPGAFAPSADGMGPALPQPPQQPGGGDILSLSRQLGIPAQAIQADVVFNGGKKISEMLATRSAPKWENVNGNLVNTNAPNFQGGFQPGMAAGKDGQVTAWQPDGKGGLVVGAPAGAMDTYRAFKQTDADVASGHELVKVTAPDGSERYVPKSQALRAAQPQPQAQPQAQPRPMARPGALTQPGDSDRQMILQSEMKAAQGRLASATNPDEQRRANEDIAALGRELGSGPMQASPTTAQVISRKGAEVTAEQTAKDVAEQRKSIMNSGFSAPSNIAKYQQIGKLLADVDGGALTPTGTHLASLANSVGLKIDKNLPNKEAAASLANEAALTLRSPAGGAGMPGAMSDQDRTFLQSMTPNLAQSAQGRKMVIESYVAVQQRNQQVATFARNYEKKYGRLDNGFFDQMQAWSNANPLFGKK